MSPCYPLTLVMGVSMIPNIHSLIAIASGIRRRGENFGFFNANQSVSAALAAAGCYLVSCWCLRLLLTAATGFCCYISTCPLRLLPLAAAMLLPGILLAGDAGWCHLLLRTPAA